MNPQEAMGWLNQAEQDNLLRQQRMAAANIAHMARNYPSLVAQQAQTPPQVGSWGFGLQGIQTTVPARRPLREFLAAAWANEYVRFCAAPIALIVILYVWFHA